LPSPLSFIDFKRKFERFGVSVSKSKGKASHIKMRKVIDGVVVPYTAVKHHNRVDYCYVAKARRKFRLTEEDGVTDEDFKKA